MTEKTKATSFRELAEKGNGVLVRRGSVWSYPGAPNDASGTNLQLPAEYVTDVEVQEALRVGDLVAVTQTPANQVMSVRLKGKNGDPMAKISTVQAGTAEAGTQLPPNSRPTHDAGRAAISPAEASEQTRRALETALPARNAMSGVVEGAAARGRDNNPKNEPTTADQGPRKGR
jgi:hypothetical protein